MDAPRFLYTFYFSLCPRSEIEFPSSFTAYLHYHFSILLSLPPFSCWPKELLHCSADRSARVTPKSSIRIFSRGVEGADDCMNRRASHSLASPALKFLNPGPGCLYFTQRRTFQSYIVLSRQSSSMAFEAAITITYQRGLGTSQIRKWDAAGERLAFNGNSSGQTHHARSPTHPWFAVKIANTSATSRDAVDLELRALCGWSQPPIISLSFSLPMLLGGP